jgi:hypothetical protein
MRDVPAHRRGGSPPRRQARPPRQTRTATAAMGRTQGTKATKTIVVCANCHYRIHHRQPTATAIRSSHRRAGVDGALMQLPLGCTDCSAGGSRRGASGKLPRHPRRLPDHLPHHLPHPLVTVSVRADDRAAPGTEVVGQGGRRDAGVRPRKLGVSQGPREVDNRLPDWAFRQISAGR